MYCRSKGRVQDPCHNIKGLRKAGEARLPKDTPRGRTTSEKNSG